MIATSAKSRGCGSFVTTSQCGESGGLWRAFAETKRRRGSGGDDAQGTEGSCSREVPQEHGAGAWVVSAGAKLTNAGVSGEVRSGGAATAPVRRRNAAGGYARTPAPRGTSSTRRNRRWNAAP